jgi:hypothetical protein
MFLLAASALLTFAMINFLIERSVYDSNLSDCFSTKYFTRYTDLQNCASRSCFPSAPPRFLFWVLVDFNLFKNAYICRFS